MAKQRLKVKVGDAVRGGQKGAEGGHHEQPKESQDQRGGGRGPTGRWGVKRARGRCSGGEQDAADGGLRLRDVSSRTSCGAGSVLPALRKIAHLFSSTFEYKLQV